MTQYSEIATTMRYISQNSEASMSQIDSLQIAKFLEVSKFDFQKMWLDWCGTEFEMFISFLSLRYFKTLLAQDINLAATSGLHFNKVGNSSLFRPEIVLRKLSLSRSKNTATLRINYSYHDSVFGEFLVASTSGGVCNILFFDSKTAALSDLKSRWSQAELVEKVEQSHLEIAELLSSDFSKSFNYKIQVELCGSDFQLKVWEILLSIPFGQVTTYGIIATKLGDPRLARAVGAAIGANPIGFLIPCHRVIASSGAISGYRWGVDRKLAMLGYEAVKTQLLS